MQKRYVVWWLLLLQVICYSIIEINMNIAIVSMIRADGRHRNTNTADPIPAVCPNSTIFLTNFFEDTHRSSSRIERDSFAWSEAEQNMVLSGYFWLKYIANLAGGILTQKFGAKKMIGFSQLLSSTLSSFIPIFGYYGPTFVASIRAIQGLLSSMTYPSAISAMIGNWSAPQERGRFELTSFIGFAIGFSIAGTCFGYISEYIHWKYVFHITSIFGIILSLLWFVFVHDSPESHPNISFQEKKHIRENLPKSHPTKTFIPWKNILTSRAAILSIITHVVGAWLYFMPALYLPVYLKTMYGFNADEIGILTSLWSILASATAVIVGYLTDISIKNKFSTTTRTRKFCTFLGCSLASILLIIIANFQCNVNLVIIIITVYSILQACSTFGPGLTMVDISPQYCGILVGIAAFLGNVQLFLFSLLINYLTGVWKTELLWKNIFSFTTLYVISFNIVFFAFGTSQIQHWNSPTIDEPAENRTLDIISEVDPMFKFNKRSLNPTE